MQAHALKTLLERPVDRHILSNGLTLLHTPDKKAPVVSVQVWVKTGSIHEAGLLGTGVSHYLEHMLFKGTHTRTFSEISSQVQMMGGNVNAYTTFNRTVYYIDGPTECLPMALEMLADMTFNSLLDEGEATRERDVILREIEMGRDDPDRRMMQRVFSEVFRTHPFGLPVIGERALFETLSREDLWTYYQERYAPNNIVLSVGGDVGDCDLREQVETFFGREPMRRLAPVWIPPESEQLAARTYTEYADYNVARGSLAFRVPGLRSVDAASLDILSSILGSGNSSLLWKHLHDDLELVNAIDATCWNPGEQGIFWISYVCENGSEVKVAEEITALLSSLDENSINAAVLDKARKCAEVSLVNSMKTASGMASRTASYEVVVGDLGYPKQYFARLAEQTPERLLEVARRYFVPERSSRVHLCAESQESTVSVDAGVVSALPDFSPITLANGVRILLQPVEGLPKVHLRAVMFGGPLYEGAEEKGGSALLSTLLVRDTERLSAYEVARSIESVGGAFHEFAGNNTFGLSAEVLSEDSALAVQLMSEGILTPAFNEATFVRERADQVAHIRECMDDIVEFSRTKLRSDFFGAHPYACDALGEPEVLEAMTVEGMRALYQRLVVPENLIISVSGQFEIEAMREQLEAAFGSMQGGAFTVARQPFAEPAKVGRFFEQFEGEQTVVQCAFPDVGITSESYYAGEMLDELLSGMASRLFEQVRERRGLAYYVHASRMLGMDCGMFTLCAGTTWEQHEEVITLMHAELQRVREGKVSEEELVRCRTRLSSQKRLQQQSPSSRAMNAGLNLAYGLPLDLWRQYDARLASVDAVQLAAFAEHFTEGKALTLVTHPEG